MIDTLFGLGVEGIQELDDEIVTHVRNADRGALTTALQLADPAAAIEYHDTPDVDWNSEWRSRLSAQRLGRIVVTPPWLADRFMDSERIVIEPGMAFGTGDHETTRGVLRLMQNVVRDGDVVADLGAGSAVLAIAAAKLGARRAIAIELDADAIGNAETNISLNQVTDRVTVLEGDAHALLPLVAPVRVVIANIVSSVLLELLPVIAASLASEGRAILSGMLREERKEMERAFTTAGWALEDFDEEGSWWSATIARR